MCNLPRLHFTNCLTRGNYFLVLFEICELHVNSTIDSSFIVHENENRGKQEN